MLKLAILDDYQNVAQDFVNLKKLSTKYQIEIFNKPFEDEEDAIEKLKDFEALFVMRERTKITEGLINNLKKRLHKRKKLNRYDNFKTTFYKKVQKGYIKISHKNKKRYILIDSNKKIAENKKIIINKLNKLLNLKND